jgi:hypothetical protein
MRWLIGIILGFLAVLGVNGYMLYVALQNPAQVEKSYNEEKR